LSWRSSSQRSKAAHSYEGREGLPDVHVSRHE
jgi:hypothetical protein